MNSIPGTPSIYPTTPATYTGTHTVTFASYETGGTLPYTYTFHVFNSITGSLIGSQSGSSNTFAYTAYPVNTIYANVLVTDGATVPESANSAQSALITINQGSASPLVVSLSPQYVFDPIGTPLFLNASLTGGVAPYTYNFVVFDQVGNEVLNRTFSGITSTYFITSFVPNYQSTYYANVTVTDSQPISANSIKSEIIIPNSGGNAGGSTGVAGIGVPEYPSSTFPIVNATTIALVNTTRQISIVCPVTNSSSFINSSVGSAECFVVWKNTPIIPIWIVAVIVLVVVCCITYLYGRNRWW